MASRIEDQLPRFCFLGNKVRNAVIAAETIAAKEDDDFFPAMLSKAPGDFRGRVLLGQQRGFIRAAYPGFAEFARREFSPKSLEVARGRLESAQRLIRDHLRRRAQRQNLSARLAGLRQKFAMLGIVACQVPAERKRRSAASHGLE